jgi:hypothetical protein
MSIEVERRSAPPESDLSVILLGLGAVAAWLYTAAPSLVMGPLYLVGHGLLFATTGLVVRVSPQLQVVRRINIGLGVASALVGLLLLL